MAGRQETGSPATVPGRWSSNSGWKERIEAGVGFGTETEQGGPHKKTRATLINVPRVTVVANAR